MELDKGQARVLAVFGGDLRLRLVFLRVVDWICFRLVS